MRYMNCLKEEHYKALYYRFRDLCKLYKHVYKVEQRARNMFDEPIEHLAKYKLLSNLICGCYIMGWKDEQYS